MSDNVVRFPTHKVLRVIENGQPTNKKLVDEIPTEEKIETAVDQALASLLMSLEEDGIDSENPLLIGRMPIFKRILTDTLVEMHGGPRTTLITELLVKI